MTDEINDWTPAREIERDDWDEWDVLKCLTANNHRTGPNGAKAYSDWADQMIRTHVQSQCPECGLWVIWTEKTA